MERLWSYLRRFSRITKEMNPAHRIDILVHALIYYGMKKKEKLCKHKIKNTIVSYDKKVLVYNIIVKL